MSLGSRGLRSRRQQPMVRRPERLLPLQSTKQRRASLRLGRRILSSRERSMDRSDPVRSISWIGREADGVSSMDTIEQSVVAGPRTRMSRVSSMDTIEHSVVAGPRTRMSRVCPRWTPSNIPVVADRGRGRGRVLDGGWRTGVVVRRRTMAGVSSMEELEDAGRRREGRRFRRVLDGGVGGRGSSSREGRRFGVSSMEELEDAGRRREKDDVQACPHGGLEDAGRRREEDDDSSVSSMEGWRTRVVVARRTTIRRVLDGGVGGRVVVAKRTTIQAYPRWTTCSIRTPFGADGEWIYRCRAPRQPSAGGPAAAR